MENNIAEKTHKVEDITPGFEDLEKRFEERTEAYDNQKKNIVGRCGNSHFTLHFVPVYDPHTSVVLHPTVSYLMSHISLCAQHKCFSSFKHNINFLLIYFVIFWPHKSTTTITRKKTVICIGTFIQYNYISFFHIFIQYIFRFFFS